MGTKRVILEIEESLHKRIKDFAAKDKRTLTVVLRIMTKEMLEKLITDKENSLKLTGTITQEETEIAQYGSVLTTDQRGYFKQNPSNTLKDYTQFLTDTGHEPKIF